MNTEATKTAALQANMICPIWAVWYGHRSGSPDFYKQTVSLFYSRHHVDQFTRALALNGTDYRAFDGKGVAL